MESPLTLAVDFQKNLAPLVAAGNQEFLNLYNYATATGNFDEFAKILRENYPKIYNKYSSMGDTLSVGYYNTLRQNAVQDLKTKPSAYAATKAINIEKTTEEALSAVGYGLSLAYRGFPAQSVKEVFAGTNNQAVYQGVFEGMVANFDKDTFAAEYKRIPSANACAFCLEVAAATGETFEEGFDQKFHKNCKCVTVVTFDNQKDLDIRRDNLKEYERQRDIAKERIRAGEFSEFERVIPRNSQEYRNYAERELRSASREYRQTVAREDKLNSDERRELRERTNEEIEFLLPKIASGQKLTQDDYDMLDKWMDPFTFDNTLHKPITNVSHKDLLWVMRNEYSYR